jgi:hypothetical protein
VSLLAWIIILPIALLDLGFITYCVNDIRTRPRR